MRKILLPEQLDRSAMALVKAGLKGSLFKSAPQLPQLPEHQLHCRHFSVSSELVKQYHQLVHWSRKDLIHPAFIHVMAMPLHLRLLSEEHFPFKITGLVHISNVLHQHGVFQCGDELDLICYLADLEPHHKGWKFSLVTQAWCKRQLVWQEISTNLALCQQQIVVPREPVESCEVEWGDSATFNFSNGDGRRYAKVSGDYNPIHLWPWSAKMLGFRRHIAHGMYTYALCISALYPKSVNFNEPWFADVKFVKPLFLPSAQVQLQTNPQHGHYRLTSKDQERVYLQGEMGLVNKISEKWPLLCQDSGDQDLS